MLSSSTELEQHTFLYLLLSLGCFATSKVLACSTVVASTVSSLGMYAELHFPSTLHFTLTHQYNSLEVACGF
ncbi:hypothetical protein VNO78_21293 [Psophocarpus tetragonolobus]|uniref:Uncharacterized protein n=1 Tax=Psophocarpus tetragonolobus TaxID=3891 RepID=A0AAN9XI90_PSOTE